MTDNTRDEQNVAYLLGYLLEAVESTLNNMGNHPRLAMLRSEVEFVKHTRTMFTVVQHALATADRVQAARVEAQEGDPQS